jgi:hypothetical protein
LRIFQSKTRNPKSNWWTERDSNPYEKCAGLLCCQITSSARKYWCRRRDSTPARVSFSQSRIRSARLFLFPPLRRVKINTDGESRTHITTILNRVPLPIGLRRRKKIEIKFGLGGRIQACENLLPRQVRIVICGTPRY